MHHFQASLLYGGAMFHNGTGQNGLAIIVDSRTRQDAQDGGCLNTSRWRHFFGDAEWKRTLRIALREYGSEPYTSKDLACVKVEVDRILREHAVFTLLLMQSPATPGVRHVHSSWNMYGHAGSPYKWAGTVQAVGEYRICPVLNPSNYEDVYEYLIRRWFCQAHAVASRRITPMPFPDMLHTTPNTSMVSALTRICEDRRSPIAIDIETNTSGTIITAIGLSNGKDTISAPWDSFHISGTDDEEPSLTSYEHGHIVSELVNTCLRSINPKILHNGAFDIYELSKRSLTVNNFAYDTLLMHRVVYPQFRHGLQQACATEFCVEPWKCVWKPPSAVRGTGEDVWLSDPIEMRKYNCRDSFATWVLFNKLRTKVGV